jgi:predicted metal-dependent hydrolase
VTARAAALGVPLPSLRIRRMRSRWGSCAIRTRAVTLALELAWREPQYLGYILVHELAHLKERSHGPRFKAILGEHVPGWRVMRRELNGEA